MCCLYTLYIDRRKLGIGTGACLRICFSFIGKKALRCGKDLQFFSFLLNASCSAMTLENLQCSLLLNAAAVWVMGFWAMGVICGSGVVFILFWSLLLFSIAFFTVTFRAMKTHIPSFLRSKS